MSPRKTPLLDQIDSPAALKALSLEETRRLAEEIRGEIVTVTSRNGGHVASNLGVVELTIALHRVFDAPRDKLIWDTSHQCYAHKLLTGRRELFRSLRKENGCIGFTSREESPYDAFGAGHAGTAISAALGMAVARDRGGRDEHVVAIIGDASLNCGISLEALNSVRDATRRLIIVLNDNKMSISRNVGGIAAYLNSVIPSKGYNSLKAWARKWVQKIPRVGDRLTHSIARFEEAVKSVLVPGVLFEELGVRYIGPVDGHNIADLVWTLEHIKAFESPVILHAITEKGRGYELAEDSPETFHGLSGYDPETGQAPRASTGVTYSTVFGQAVIALAEEKPDVVAITAAMRSGTGLSEFAGRFPKRFFDTGIAEEHALVFAAGMAAEGLRPVMAIYATFLQRAVDCVYHDICLQNLPVIVCADRSGAVDDGPTHHGIYDLAFLRGLPNLSILCPFTGKETRDMLFMAYDRGGPVVIRYSRGTAPDAPSAPLVWGQASVLREGDDLTIWAMGRECATALEVAAILETSGRRVKVVNARFLRPFDTARLLEDARRAPLATIEDNQLGGGLAAEVDQALINAPRRRVFHFGWGDSIIPHGAVERVREAFGLTAAEIARTLLNAPSE